MAKNGKKTSSRSETVSADSPDSTLSIAYFDRRMAELQNTLASKEDLNQLREIISKQNEKINQLEAKVEGLDNRVNSLEIQGEESEQYSRRLCLRFEGITAPNNEKAESPEDVLLAVKKIISDCGVTIPDDAIDRAHRTGKGKVIAGKRYRQIIVRFTSFSYVPYCTRLEKTRTDAAFAWI